MGSQISHYWSRNSQISKGEGCNDSCGNVLKLETPYFTGYIQMCVCVCVCVRAHAHAHPRLILRELRSNDIPEAIRTPKAQILVSNNTLQ